MPVAQVQRVVQQPLDVGADIERHREYPARVDARRGGVDGQLADGDHAAGYAPVANAEDLFRVTADDEVDVIRPEAQAGEGLVHVVWPVDRQVEAAGPAVLVRVTLDGVADDRVVHHWQELG